MSDVPETIWVHTPGVDQRQRCYYASAVKTKLYTVPYVRRTVAKQLQRDQDTRCQQYETRLSDMADKLGEAKALLRRAVIVINHAVDMGHMPMTQSEIDWIVDLSREMIGDIHKTLHPTTGGQDENL